MIPLKEALRIVLDAAQPLGNERVDLANALGRILAEDVAADMDMPPFDRATVDGYACRRADLGGCLSVVEVIPAGTGPTRVIGPNQCAKIMTGAAVPQGADCVIMIEHSETVGENLIRFTGGPTPDNIRPKAEDIRCGQIVLNKGARIGPPHIAVLASVGCTRPLVARRPGVAVIPSGDEIIPATEKPNPFQIRNSNGPQLVAQLEAMGLTGHHYGIVPDTEGDIDRVLKAAMAENDVVVFSGGVSMGDFDLIPAVLRRNGISLQFEKIAVKPGKPTVFGRAENGYCFGLPGNPVSTFIIFELLVKPFLYRLMGGDYSPIMTWMHLDETVVRTDTQRQEWMPVQRTSETTVRPMTYHGSGHILALCRADGLITMEIGQERIEKGMSVRVRPIGV